MTARLRKVWRGVQDSPSWYQCWLNIFRVLIFHRLNENSLSKDSSNERLVHIYETLLGQVSDTNTGIEAYKKTLSHHNHHVVKHLYTKNSYAEHWCTSTMTIWPVCVYEWRHTMCLLQFLSSLMYTVPSLVHQRDPLKLICGTYGRTDT